MQPGAWAASGSTARVAQGLTRLPGSSCTQSSSRPACPCPVECKTAPVGHPHSVGTRCSLVLVVWASRSATRTRSTSQTNRVRVVSSTVLQVMSHAGQHPAVRLIMLHPWAAPSQPEPASCPPEHGSQVAGDTHARHIVHQERHRVHYQHCCNHAAVSDHLCDKQRSTAISGANARHSRGQRGATRWPSRNAYVPRVHGVFVQALAIGARQALQAQATQGGAGEGTPRHLLQAAATSLALPQHTCTMGSTSRSIVAAPSTPS